MVRFKNMALRHKLMMTYLTVVIIPLLLLGGLAFYIAERNAFSSYIDYVQHDVDSFVADSKSRLIPVTTVTDHLSCNTSLSQNLSRQYVFHYDIYTTVVHNLEPMLNSVMIGLPEIQSIQFYTSHPVLKKTNVCDPLNRLSELNLHDPIHSRQGQAFYIDDQNLRVLCPILPYNTIENYVMATVPLERLFIPPAHWEDCFSWGLYGEDGHLVYCPTSSGLLIPAVMPELDMHGNDSHYCVQNGMLILESSDLFLDMKVILFQPTYSLHASMTQILWGTLAVALCCILLVIVVSYILSRTMASRLEYLSAQLSKFDAGNLDLRIYDDSTDEIGVLSNRLDLLLQAIRQLIDDIYQSEKSRKDAEMKMFHSMIKPHFLYNIFSVINWKALTDGNTQISTIALSAATYYRTVLNNGQQIISIDKELDGVRAYLEIQEIMHDHSFTCSYDISPDVHGYRMPCFILQPIVENAIKHGLENKRIGHGTLTLRAELQADRIVFHIHDNGPGMPAEVLEKLRRHDFTGYGLKNISQKLELYYGKDYTLSFSSDPFTGTTVVLSIPVTPSSASDSLSQYPADGLNIP